MESGGVFQSRSVLEPSYQITAIDYSNTYLYVGDQNGNVYRLQVNIQEMSDMITSHSDKPCQLSKQKIEQIKVIDEFDNLVVLAEDKIFYLSSDLKKLAIINPKSQKVQKISFFIMNQGKQQKALVVGGNKQIQLIEFAKDAAEFKASIQLSHNPQTALLMDTQIILGYKQHEKDQSYQQLLTNEEGITWQVNTKFDYKSSENPYVFALNNLEIFLTTTGIALFINTQGSVIDRSTVFIQPERIYNIKFIQPYLIIQYEKELRVYNINLNQNQHIQTIAGKGNPLIKSISSSGDRVFYALSNHIYALQVIPYETQIKQCLAEGKVQKAEEIFSQHNQPSDANYKQNLEKFSLDCAWSYFKQLSFEESMKKLENLDYDPRELISLFPDLIPLTKKIIYQKTTILQLIQDRIDPKAASKSQSNYKDNDTILVQYKFKAKEQLAQQLQKKKTKILQNPAKLKEVVHFISSNMSPNTPQPGQLTAAELLELIDFVLIKSYIDIQQFDNLKKILLDKQTNCKQYSSEILSAITNQPKIKETNQDILALCYEKFEQYEQALNIWRDHGQSQLAKQGSVNNQAVSQTIKILKEQGNLEMIKKYFTWVLKGNPDQIHQLVKDMNNLNHDQMLLYFKTEVFPNESDKLQQLQERYLETIVQTNKIEEERFHTSLALMYIEQCFARQAPNTPRTQIQKDHPKLKTYLDKFEKFYKDPASKYNASTLINKIQNSWMIDQEIYLYSRERRHDEALLKLIGNDEFMWAEQYSANQEDKLLTKLIKIYNDLINSGLAKIQKDPNSPDCPKLKQQIELYKKNINNILKKYATHPQLDPLEVLNVIPDDWKLSDQQGGDDGLYTFLSSVISYTMHQKRKTDSAKSLSEMDAVNASYQLAKAKQAYLKISPDKQCSVCKKLIGDKVFVVYPNGVVAHHQCVGQFGLSVCPLTKQDFERTFKG